MGIGRTYFAPANNTDAASVQLWVKGGHLAILATGVTDVSASGAVSESQWETFGVPATGNKVIGWVVYAFSDALQATLPIYIKVEYASAAFNTRQQHYITVGTTHDGSGSIGGQVTPRTGVSSAANGVNTHQWFIGGDGSYLTGTGPIHDVIAGTDFTSAWCWAVERTKDITGADTADGFLVGLANQSTYYWFSVPASGSVPAVDTEWPLAMPTRNPATLGGRSVVCPVYPVSAVSQNPCRNLLGTRLGNYTPNDIVPVSIYPGKEATYLMISSGLTLLANESNGRILLRWT